MQNYDIRLKRYNGIDYDTLYPETKTSLLIGSIEKSQLTAGATYTATSVILVNTDWDSTNLDQTVTVQGVTASNAVIISPDVSSLTAYGENGVYCFSQATNSLTFKCSSIPSSNISVNVLILT